MTKTLLEKMFAKPAYTKAILHTPEELKPFLLTMDNIDTKLISLYDFIVTFYIKKDELKKEVSQLKEKLNKNSLLWIAYPKNKLLQTDLNRDILHEEMKQYGFDGVSLISLNETWSAMRFKRI